MYNIPGSLSLYLIKSWVVLEYIAVGGMPVVDPAFRVSSIPVMTWAQFLIILFEISEGSDNSSPGTLLTSSRFSFTSQPGPAQRNSCTLIFIGTD